MSKEKVLITGASGEVGRLLLPKLLERYDPDQIVLMDRQRSQIALPEHVTFIEGDVSNLLEIDTLDNENWDRIYHLAAILSAKGEENPRATHRINTWGSLQVFELARKSTERTGNRVRVMFPSTIAVYGLDGTSRRTNVREDEFLSPITMYGVSKLGIEQAGRYYARHFKVGRDLPRIDFRSVRFPGLLSPASQPGGGTTDFGPHILHHAKLGKPYVCPVRPSTTLPFMAMSDAIDAIMDLGDADLDPESALVYNVSSFSMSAEEFVEVASDAFGDVDVIFEEDDVKQEISDSWPESIDDTLARGIWNWAPKFDHHTTFSKYMIPGLK